jgi:adenosylhomocysteinase
MLTDEDIKDKKFVIFGFGKVGKGVAYFLKKHTDNIVIIDVDAQALKSAQDKGLNALDLNQFKEVKREIDSAYAVASATGIEHALSKSFKPKDKKVFEGKYLANIGIDEFGDLFDETEILYNKKWPINFALPDPTKMRYLDPSFYAHNLGPEIILSKDFEPGYHTFPEDIDDEIMKEWQDFHDEDISLSQE